MAGREADMVANHAGGFVFATDDWGRLERFLILGTEDLQHAHSSSSTRPPVRRIQTRQAASRARTVVRSRADVALAAGIHWATLSRDRRDEFRRAERRREEAYRRTDPAINVGSRDEIVPFLEDHREIGAVLGLNRHTDKDDVQAYSEAAGDPNLPVLVLRFDDKDERAATIGWPPMPFHMRDMLTFLRGWRLRATGSKRPSLAIHCAQGKYRSSAAALVAHHIATGDDPETSAAALAATDGDADPNWEMARLCDDLLDMKGSLHLAARRLSVANERQALYWFKYGDGAVNGSANTCRWCENAEIDPGAHEESVDAIRQSGGPTLDKWLLALHVFVVRSPHVDVDGGELAERIAVDAQGAKIILDRLAAGAGGYERLLEIARLRPRTADFGSHVLFGEHAKTCDLNCLREWYRHRRAEDREAYSPCDDFYPPLRNPPQ